MRSSLIYGDLVGGKHLGLVFMGCTMVLCNLPSLPFSSTVFIGTYFQRHPALYNTT